MSESQTRTVTREEFNRELTQALDDLVADARHHGELIQAAFDKPAKPRVARETSPPDGEVPERLDRIEARLDRLESRMDRMEARLDRMERTLTEIREQTADSKGIARDALPAARGAKESGATHRETPVASRQ